MITQQAQIKINLPVVLKEFVESKASRFGMPIAAYIKHLILKDVEDMEYPSFELSEKAEKALQKALKEKDKAVEIKDVDEYFKNL